MKVERLKELAAEANRHNEKYNYPTVKGKKKKRKKVNNKK